MALVPLSRAWRETWKRTLWPGGRSPMFPPDGVVVPVNTALAEYVTRISSWAWASEAIPHTAIMDVMGRIPSLLAQNRATPTGTIMHQFFKGNQQAAPI